MGREHFWLTVAPVEGVEEGTDRWSITPPRLDLTDAAALERIRMERPLYTERGGDDCEPWR